MEKYCLLIFIILAYIDFIFLWKLSLWFGCHDNLDFPLTYNGENWKMALTTKPLQIFWQNFYRTIPWVVLYHTHDCLPIACFHWLLWKRKCRNIEKKVTWKIIFSEIICCMRLRLHGKVAFVLQTQHIFSAKKKYISNFTEHTCQHIV